MGESIRQIWVNKHSHPLSFTNKQDTFVLSDIFETYTWTLIRACVKITLRAIINVLKLCFICTKGVQKVRGKVPSYSYFVNQMN